MKMNKLILFFDSICSELLSVMLVKSYSATRLARKANFQMELLRGLNEPRFMKMRDGYFWNRKIMKRFYNGFSLHIL